MRSDMHKPGIIHRWPKHQKRLVFVVFRWQIIDFAPRQLQARWRQWISRACDLQNRAARDSRCAAVDNIER